jgi:hypothetical protein
MEDAAGAAAAWEKIDLVGDAGARGVDQVDHRDAVTQRVFDDPDDLLDGAGTPRAGLDGRVVGHDRHRPAFEGGGAGDDAVGGQVARVDVGEGAVLHKGVRVDEQPNPLAREELGFRGVRVVVALGAPTLDRFT